MGLLLSYTSVNMRRIGVKNQFNRIGVKNQLTTLLKVEKNVNKHVKQFKIYVHC